MYSFQHLLSLIIVMTCTSTLTLLFSVELSRNKVQVTSFTECICGGSEWHGKAWPRNSTNYRRHSPLLEQLKGGILEAAHKEPETKQEDQESGVVTVKHEERPQWLQLKSSDLDVTFSTDSLAAIQPRRKDHLQKTCRKLVPNRYSNYKLSDLTLKHLFVNEKHKFIYCAVPKAGSTNWKRIIMALENSSLSLNEITRDIAHHSPLKTLRQYPESERKLILEQYTKFVFTRDPFVRLISAFKDKFQRIRDLDCETHSNYFKKMAVQIMLKYRQGVTQESLRTGEGLTWTEFISHILDAPDRLKLNEHWQTMFALCAPCSIKYDYIGKLETVREDSSRLLKRLGVGKNIYYLKSHNVTARDSREFYQAFGDTTIHQLRKLWKIYEMDFELFNYTQPNFLKDTTFVV